MKDINRLDNFYNELKKIHKDIPDWRFGLLIINFQRWCDWNKDIRDIFYIEEEEILKLLKLFIKDIYK